jgi:hypothetical protein
MPDGHWSEMPQVTAVDGQFGTHNPRTSPLRRYQNLPTIDFRGSTRTAPTKVQTCVLLA